MSQAGEVIEIDRERMVELVQRDAEISEILMRAFILRRVQLIACVWRTMGHAATGN